MQFLGYNICKSMLFLKVLLKHKDQTRHSALYGGNGLREACKNNGKV